MKTMLKYKEALKDVLIALLSVSAIWMAWKTALFNDMFLKDTTAQQGTAISVSSSDPYDTVLPRAAAVTWKSGVRFGVEYDNTIIQKIMKQFSVLLEEAFGTISEPRKITDAEWREKLNLTGLYLEYACPLALTILAGQVETAVKAEDSFTVCRIILVSGNNNLLELCFEDALGQHYCCETFAAEKTLEKAVRKYLPNGAEFAYQIQSLSDCDPFLLIADSELDCYVIEKTAADWEKVFDTISSILGLVPDSAGKYEDGEDVVYLCSEGKLRVKEQDSFEYINTVSDHREKMTLREQFETAGRIVIRLSTACGGGASIQLISYTNDGNLTEFNFSYAVNGLPVTEPQKNVSVRFENGSLSSIVFFARSYLQTTKSAAILPALQAAAAAAELTGGEEAVLSYLDNGAVFLEPLWIAGNGED